jgi:hypothetical protein
VLTFLLATAAATVALATATDVSKRDEKAVVSIPIQRRELPKEVRMLRKRASGTGFDAQSLNTILGVSSKSHLKLLSTDNYSRVRLILQTSVSVLLLNGSICNLIPGVVTCGLSFPAIHIVLIMSATRKASVRIL